MKRYEYKVQGCVYLSLNNSIHVESTGNHESEAHLKAMVLIIALVSVGKCLKMTKFLKPCNTFLAIWHNFELLNLQTWLNHHFIAKMDIFHSMSLS